MSLYQDYLKEIDLRKEDGIHPNKEGVLKIVKKIAPFVRDLLKRVKL